MSREILVQYLGFQSKPAFREYTFQVREAATEPREFSITIAHEAFSSQRLKFQDAPDICSAKLRRELLVADNHPSDSRFHISDAELESYRERHATHKRTSFPRKEFRE